MRFLLIIIVLITVATVALQAWLGSPALQITFGHWVVELHPSVLLPVLLITFFVLYILFGALLAIKRVPQEYRRLRLLRRLKRKNACLEKGMLGLIEGDWRQAGRFLNEGARLSDNAPVYQLGLAQVADHEGRLMDRQMHLALARHVDKHGSLGAALTQARLLHARSDNANAIICLLEARKEHPHSQELNHFLLDVLQSEKRWTEVLAQLSYCRLADGKQQLIQQRAYKHLLRQAAAVGDREALHSSWSRMPRSLKRTGEMVQVYVRACLQCGEAGSCESMLRSQLKHQDAVDIDLAMLYSMLPPEGTGKASAFCGTVVTEKRAGCGVAVSSSACCTCASIRGSEAWSSCKVALVCSRGRKFISCWPFWPSRMVILRPPPDITKWSVVWAPMVLYWACCRLLSRRRMPADETWLHPVRSRIRFRSESDFPVGSQETRFIYC